MIDYKKQKKALASALAKLDKSLDALEEARAGGDAGKVPGLLKKVRAQMNVAEELVDQVEDLRQQYWIDRAKAATDKLVSTAGPLVQEIVFCWNATCVPSLQRTTVGATKELLSQPLAAHAEPDSEIPAEPLGLPEELQRADRDACFSNVAKWRIRQGVE